MWFVVLTKKAQSLLNRMMKWSFVSINCFFKTSFLDKYDVKFYCLLGKQIERQRDQCQNVVMHVSLWLFFPTEQFHFEFHVRSKWSNRVDQITQENKLTQFSLPYKENLANTNRLSMNEYFNERKLYFRFAYLHINNSKYNVKQA